MEELQDKELNGVRHKNDDENLALVIQVNKGNLKKFSNGYFISRDNKKYMIKVKCYACHNFGHYAGQCTNKKGGNKMQPEVVVLEKDQMDDFSKKFENS